MLYCGLLLGDPEPCGYLRGSLPSECWPAVSGQSSAGVSAERPTAWGQSPAGVPSEHPLSVDRILLGLPRSSRCLWTEFCWRTQSQLSVGSCWGTQRKPQHFISFLAVRLILTGPGLWQYHHLTRCKCCHFFHSHWIKETKRWCFIEVTCQYHSSPSYATQIRGSTQLKEGCCDGKGATPLAKYSNLIDSKV